MEKERKIKEALMKEIQKKYPRKYPLDPIAIQVRHKKIQIYGVHFYKVVVLVDRFHILTDIIY